MGFSSRGLGIHRGGKQRTMQQEQKPRAYILTHKYKAERTNPIFSSDLKTDPQ